MDNIIELKLKIKTIEAEFDEELRPLKNKVLQIEQEKIKELTPLLDEYDALCESLIEEHNSGTLEKIAGVQFRELKDFEIVDESLLPKEYFKVSIDKAKIKEKLRETDYTENIPGVKAFKKTSIAVKI